MSDTPRTDASALGFARILVDKESWTTTDLVESNFARQLERELTTEYQRGLNAGLEQAARICKEEADKETVVNYHLTCMHCAEAIRAKIKK